MTSTIPVEVLGAVFSFVMGHHLVTPSREGMEELNVLCLVSQHWRQTALATASLWGSLVLDSQFTSKKCTQAERWLARSKGVPKTLVLDAIQRGGCDSFSSRCRDPGTCAFESVPLATLLTEGPSPLRHLSIICERSLCLENLQRQLLSPPRTQAPRPWDTVTSFKLETHEHWNHYEESGEVYDEANSDYPILENLPVTITRFNLTVAHLIDYEGSNEGSAYILKLPDSVLNRLSHFTFSCSMNTSTILGVLASCRHLQALCLVLPYSTWSDPDETDLKLDEDADVFPDLRHLRIHSCEVPALEYLRAIRAPRLQTLALIIDGIDANKVRRNIGEACVDSIADFLDRSQCHSTLTHLRINCVPLPDLYSVLVKLPSLSHLNLSSVGNYSLELVESLASSGSKYKALPALKVLCVLDAPDWFPFERVRAWIGQRKPHGMVDVQVTVAQRRHRVGDPEVDPSEDVYKFSAYYVLEPNEADGQWKNRTDYEAPHQVRLLPALDPQHGDLADNIAFATKHRYTDKAFTARRPQSFAPTTTVESLASLPNCDTSPAIWLTLSRWSTLTIDKDSELTTRISKGYPQNLIENISHLNRGQDNQRALMSPLAPSNEGMQQLNRLCLVSRRWREAALATARLWSSLVLVRPFTPEKCSQAGQWLGRSKGLGKTLVVDAFGSWNYFSSLLCRDPKTCALVKEPLVRLLTEGPGPLRHLSITCERSLCLENLQRLISRPYTQACRPWDTISSFKLETIEEWNHYEETDGIEGHANSDYPILQNLPITITRLNLSIAELDGFEGLDEDTLYRLKFPEPFLNRLTHFTFACALKSSTIINILASCRHVQALCLDLEFVPWSEPDETKLKLDDEAHVLPDLRHLRIMNCHLDATQYLRALVAPRLQTLAISTGFVFGKKEFENPGSCIACIGNFLDRSQCHLTLSHFRLDGVQVSNLYSVLMRLPALIHLVMTCIGDFSLEPFDSLAELDPDGRALPALTFLALLGVPDLLSLDTLHAWLERKRGNGTKVVEAIVTQNSQCSQYRLESAGRWKVSRDFKALNLHPALNLNPNPCYITQSPSGRLRHSFQLCHHHRADYFSMECRNCELRQRQFFCRTCIKTHLRDFQSQHGHYATDLSSVVSSATSALTNVVQPARIARARVADVRARIDELSVGLSGIKRECEKKRDKIRKLREDLAQRRRNLSAARILVKAGSTSPPSTGVPSTPVSAPFLNTPLNEVHDGGPPLLPPSPAHLALTQTLARARSGLVQELVDVFNIVEVGGRPPVGGKAGTKGEWTIGGLVLPVPGDIRRYPPDHINAVLTLTIHFLSLLSFYLGIKLPFEVTWTGGKLGLGQPWIGAIRGGSAGGGDGGWSRWHKKHPLHLIGQARSTGEGGENDKDARPPTSSQSNTSSSDDEDPMASSVATVKPARPTLPRIKTAAASPSQLRARTASARPGPSPIVPSPSTPRRSTTYSLSSALAGVGGVVRKGVGGVVSAGAGVVGYSTPSRLRTMSNALDESAFIVSSPTSTSPPPQVKKPPPRKQETPAHLSPSTAPPSFTTGYTMLIYNVCYLAHTQRVVPEIGLSQAGEVLSNLWRCCCSSELGRVGHESVGWTQTSNAGPGWNLHSPVSPVELEPSAGLTLVRLPPPTPPTFSMDFGQLLQAVSGAGGAGARAKTKVARRKVYSETRTRDSVAELESGEGWGYEEVGKDEERDGRDDWDLVDEDISF
ncbi:hypothetical protein NMY22_g11341 [Coprinellus aureogranulatus]|nr:hypothetical protein NMY22_g11341 [Coprinellus aureogranulatus]